MFRTENIPGCEYVGASNGMDVIKINGAIYGITGFNGEGYEATEYDGAVSSYLDKRSGFLKAVMADCKPIWECSIQPVYRYEDEGIDIGEIEEDSDEWKHAVEVVDLRIDREKLYKQPKKWL